MDNYCSNKLGPAGSQFFLDKDPVFLGGSDPNEDPVFLKSRSRFFLDGRIRIRSLQLYNYASFCLQCIVSNLEHSNSTFQYEDNI